MRTYFLFFMSLLAIVSCKFENNNTDMELPIIDTLWNFSKPGETAEKFQTLLKEVNQEENKAYYTELLTQLARTQSIQSNFSEAHEILDSVETLLENNDFPVAQIRYLLERGRTYNSSNEKGKAAPLFEQAYKLAESNNEDFYKIDAAHMLGIASQPDLQLEWNLKAMELAEQTDNERAQKWLGPLYNNIGWTYFDMADYPEAMKYFNKSLEWRVAQNDARGSFIAKWCIARNYRAMENVDTALEYQEKLLSEMEKDTSKTDPYVYEELGECYLTKEDTFKAADYFGKAYEILSKDKWMQNNQAEKLERMKKLSQHKVS